MYELACKSYEEAIVRYDKAWERHLASQQRTIDSYEANERKETVYIVERNVNGLPVYAAVAPRIAVGSKTSIEVKILNTDLKIADDGIVTVYKHNITEVTIVE